MIKQRIHGRDCPSHYTANEGGSLLACIDRLDIPLMSVTTISPLPAKLCGLCY